MDKDSLEKQHGFLGHRHIQTIQLFLLLTIAYAYRSCMSVSILAMMSDSPPYPDIPTYPNWKKKSFILSSFFWGYVVFQIGAGKLGQKFGSKLFLAYAMFINGLASILTPIFAEKFSENGVIACRVIQGVHQGFFYPNVHNLLRRWIPISERSRMSSFVYAGGIFGIVIAMPLTGVISESSMGWPCAFYIYGGVGILWVLIWIIFGSNSPDEHKFISKKEIIYINNGLPKTEEDLEEIPTPWKDICTSLPMWAILLAHCGQNWNFWTLLTETPSYLDKIMGFDLTENSLISALPYVVNWILTFPFSFISDILIFKNITTIGTTRKIMQTLGIAIPSLLLFCLGYLNKGQHILAVTILIVSVGFNAATFSGFLVNHIDIAPKHAGVLMGITNSIANIFSFITPLVVGALGYQETDLELWKRVFWIASGIGIGTNLFYIIFASGELQPWNDKKI